MNPVRFGILGAGRIARRVMKCAPYMASARLEAVASRDGERARAFAVEYGIPRAHGDYEALLADPAIDAVYVATPHPFHEAQTLAALGAGKHVLCEKPMAMNAAQAERMIRAARENKRFLMEAMWTRCFPAVRKADALLRTGAIGEMQMVTAAFSSRGVFDPASRLYKKSLGGGVLLDIGVYAVAMASLALGGGMPEAAGVAAVGETGVDESAAFSLRYPGGGLAALQCSARVNMPQTATIYGTEGSLAFPRFWSPDTLIHTGVSGESEVHTFPREGEGFQYEFDHAADCIQKGLTESPWMPLAETLTIARTMDTLLAQWGVEY